MRKRGERKKSQPCMVRTQGWQESITLLEVYKIMKNNAIVCRKCGLISGLKIEKVSLPSGGFHQKAVCAGCGKFIKFIPHSTPTLWFGKHKGATVAEIARNDPNYLRWLSEKDVKPASLMMAIRGALCKQP